MKLLLALLLAACAYGQQEVRFSQNNPDLGYQYVMSYSGTNLIYLCKALSLQPTSGAISIASATNASPVVFTVSGGHGFNTNSKPSVIISGGTGNWTGVNGTYTATVINSTTYSIAVDSTAFGAVTGTLTYTTRSPLTTNPVWNVQFFAYDGSNNMVWSGWAGGAPQKKFTCSGSPAQYQ